MNLARQKKIKIPRNVRMHGMLLMMLLLVVHHATCFTIPHPISTLRSTLFMTLSDPPNKISPKVGAAASWKNKDNNQKEANNDNNSTPMNRKQRRNQQKKKKRSRRTATTTSSAAPFWSKLFEESAAKNNKANMSDHQLEQELLAQQQEAEQAFGSLKSKTEALQSKPMKSLDTRPLPRHWQALKQLASQTKKTPRPERPIPSNKEATHLPRGWAQWRQQTKSLPDDDKTNDKLDTRTTTSKKQEKAPMTRPPPSVVEHKNPVPIQQKRNKKQDSAPVPSFADKVSTKTSQLDNLMGKLEAQQNNDTIAKSSETKQPKKKIVDMTKVEQTQPKQSRQREKKPAITSQKTAPKVKEIVLDIKNSETKKPKEEALPEKMVDTNKVEQTQTKPPQQEKEKTSFITSQKKAPKTKEVLLETKAPQQSDITKEERSTIRSTEIPVVKQVLLDKVEELKTPPTEPPKTETETEATTTTIDVPMGELNVVHRPQQWATLNVVAEQSQTPAKQLPRYWAAVREFAQSTSGSPVPFVSPALRDGVKHALLPLKWQMLKDWDHTLRHSEHLKQQQSQLEEKLPDQWAELRLLVSTTKTMLPAAEPEPEPSIQQPTTDFTVKEMTLVKTPLQRNHWYEKNKKIGDNNAVHASVSSLEALARARGLRNQQQQQHSFSTAVAKKVVPVATSQNQKPLFQQQTQQVSPSISKPTQQTTTEKASQESKGVQHKAETEPAQPVNNAARTLDPRQKTVETRASGRTNSIFYQMNGVSSTNVAPLMPSQGDTIAHAALARGKKHTDAAQEQNLEDQIREEMAAEAEFKAALAKARHDTITAGVQFFTAPPSSHQRRECPTTSTGRKIPLTQRRQILSDVSGKDLQHHNQQQQQQQQQETKFNVDPEPRQQQQQQKRNQVTHNGSDESKRGNASPWGGKVGVNERNSQKGSSISSSQIQRRRFGDIDFH